MIDEDDLKLIEQMRMSGGDMLTVAMRQFAAEYPMAANVCCYPWSNPVIFVKIVIFRFSAGAHRRAQRVDGVLHLAAVRPEGRAHCLRHRFRCCR